MTKNTRKFYLDFIRALAVILIIITHYNAVFIFQWNEELLNKIVITWKIANLYIGDFGVSLFLIVSGAALMSVYEKRLDLKEFYRKRFWGIYPMFWIAYFTAFMYTFWINKGINQAIPKINIIFSVLGMDFYVCEAVATFSIVGEWFLGFIIIFYVVFPLIRKCIEKAPLITALGVGALFVLFLCYYPLPINRSTWLFIRLPELLFGMYFVKYKLKVNWKYALAAGIVLVLNTVLQPSIDKDIQTIYVGISAFLLLGYIGSLLENKKIVVSICNTICKYSYPVFLVHHFIINRITSHFDLYDISVLESYLLFILCCCVIAFFSKLLYDANAHIVLKIKNYLT